MICQSYYGFDPKLGFPFGSGDMNVHSPFLS